MNDGQIYYVMRYRGQRAGERVRVAYESRSLEQAERYFMRKAYPKRPASFGGMEYASTMLCTDPYRWNTTSIARAGGWPHGADLSGITWEGRVTEERKAREARAEAKLTRKARRRVDAVVAEERARVVSGVRIDIEADVSQAEHEAAVVEQVAFKEDMA